MIIRLLWQILQALNQRNTKLDDILGTVEGNSEMLLEIKEAVGTPTDEDSPASPELLEFVSRLEGIAIHSQAVADRLETL